MPLRSNKKRVAGSSHPVNRPGICDSDELGRDGKNRKGGGDGAFRVKVLALLRKDNYYQSLPSMAIVCAIWQEWQGSSESIVFLFSVSLSMHAIHQLLPFHPSHFPRLVLTFPFPPLAVLVRALFCVLPLLSDTYIAGTVPDLLEQFV